MRLLRKVCTIVAGLLAPGIVPQAGGAASSSATVLTDGHYEVTFTASGNLVDGGNVTSPEVTYHFAVGDVDPLAEQAPAIVDNGDADIALAYRDETLILEVFWGHIGEAYGNDDAVYHVKPNSKITVPANPDFQFLGASDEEAWVIPQNHVEGKLFLALAGDDDSLSTGLFTDDKVEVSLIRVDGPGSFAAYETDSFGDLKEVYMNSSDGISESEGREVVVGEHYHMNWGFSEPGIYRLAFQANAVLAESGEAIESEVTEFTFRVGSASGPRLTLVRMDGGHVALQWQSQAGTSYQIQRRTTLGAGSWEDHGSPIDGNGEILTEELGEPGVGGARFYRLMEMP